MLLLKTAVVNRPVRLTDTENNLISVKWKNYSILIGWSSSVTPDSAKSATPVQKV